jgi:predicted nuclease with RNAse H fold
MVGVIKQPDRVAANGITVVGVDVGGERKGFHAVALTGEQYSGCYATTDVGQLVDWCHEVQGAVIAVDAPCRWSTDGRARPAERELMRMGIWCF